MARETTLDCGRGCKPPVDNDLVDGISTSRLGELWTCEHGAIYRLTFPRGRWLLRWKRLGPIASWFAARESRPFLEAAYDGLPRDLHDGSTSKPGMQ